MPRSQEMPIIVAHILEGRDREVKTRLIRNLTDTVARTLGVPEESVRVILSEMGKEDYGIGGKTAKERGR
ncbi:MAG: 2-hydroxymuconate tautomerase [Bacteroidota bacterium]|nr:2-hydroxymuconate tautomerase [Bacteroidota bacterium]